VQTNYNGRDQGAKGEERGRRKSPNGPQINEDWRGYQQTKNGERYGGSLTETTREARRPGG